MFVFVPVTAATAHQQLGGFEARQDVGTVRPSHRLCLSCSCRPGVLPTSENTPLPFLLRVPFPSAPAVPT
jgi:hypothetical protein